MHARLTAFVDRLARSDDVTEATQAEVDAAIDAVE